MTDRITLPSPRPGLRLYADSHDLLPAYQARTVDTLLACGAVGVIPMVEGITGDRGSQLVPLDSVRRLLDACGPHGLDVTACAFPDVRDDHGRSIDHLAACRDMGCMVELDAEPRDGAHWTPTLLAPWLALDEHLSLTTTRIEAPHLGHHGRRLRGQLEQLTSTDTLDEALRLLSAGTSLDLVEPVTGTFDQRGQVRTLAMMQRDLARCTPQAKRSGGLVVWSAHSTSPAEARVLRAWSAATWP